MAIWHICILLLLTTQAGAQIAVEAVPPQEEIKLAQPLKVVYTLKLPKETQLDLTAWVAGETQWDELTLWDYKINNTQKGLELSVFLTPFALGEMEIPDLEIPVRSAYSGAQKMAGGDHFETISTPVIPITVPDPTEKEQGQGGLHDIKEPRQPLYFWEEPWGQALIGLLLLAFIAALVLHWRARRNKRLSTVIGEEENLTPEEVFWRDMTHLENTGLMEARRWREFNFGLTEIFKDYLKRRFSLESESATTAELIKLIQIKRSELGIELSSPAELRQHLELMDLTKFAKYEPESYEQSQAIDAIKGFVDANKPKPPVEEAAPT